MRAPGRWHRWGKRACLVGAVVCAVVWIVSNLGRFEWVVVARTDRPSNHRGYSMAAITMCGSGIWIDLFRGYTARTYWNQIGGAVDDRVRSFLGSQWGQPWPRFEARYLVPRFSAGDGSVQVILPPMYPLAIFSGIYLTLHRRDRRWRRLASNACPKCKYPLTGLKPDAPCPECGAGRAAPTSEPPPASSE